MEVQTAGLTLAETGPDLSIDQQIYLLIAEGRALLASPLILQRCAGLCGTQTLKLEQATVEIGSLPSRGYDLYFHRPNSRAARGAASII